MEIWQLRAFLTQGLWSALKDMPASYELSDALELRGVTTVQSLLSEPPDSYEGWRADRDLRPAAAAARRVSRRHYEAERLALPRQETVADRTDEHDCLVLLQGIYERSPFCDQINEEMAALHDAPPREYGDLRLNDETVEIFNVDRRFSGALVWTLAQARADDQGLKAFRSELSLPAPISDVIPRWQGMTVAMSVARIVATALLLDTIAAMARPDAQHHVHALSLVHTPLAASNAQWASAGDVRAALAWLDTVTTPPRLWLTDETTAPRTPVLPSPRMLKGHEAAERYAAEVLIALGFEDVTRTPTGADGGVDVIGRGMVAQVKMEAVPTSRDRLQALFGVAALEAADAVFFSLTGYTSHAVEWADRAEFSLFEFEHDGSVLAVNAPARRLLSHGAKGRLTPTGDQH